MKKFLCLLIFFCHQAYSQELIIPAGKTKTLTDSERNLSLQKLVLGDNVTIIIPASLDGWTVTANDVTIGNNVKILGDGAYGEHGLTGSSGNIATINSTRVIIRSGGDGGNGSTGKIIELNLKIRSIGSLMINVNGGNGGNGGNGRNGSKGQDATCSFPARNGGNGGSGGRGGNGGDGGTVNIKYQVIGDISLTNDKFIIKTEGGKAGYGGGPGIGGPGGFGITCRNGNQAPGFPGSSGWSGPDGVPGKNGSSSIEIF